MALTSLLYLCSFFAGIVLSFVRNPIFGLVTYVLVLFLTPEARWWSAGLPSLRWSFIAAIMVLVGVLLHSQRFDLRTGFFKHGAAWFLMVFVALIVAQYPFALSQPLQLNLLILLVKYVVLMYLTYTILRDETSVKLFLFAYIAGAWYWGWLAYSSYEGGRFENFGADVDSNGAGLMLACGTFVAASLMLVANWPQRFLIVALIPFIVNGMITTVSRGAFLAFVCGGLTYVMLSPRYLRRWVYPLSVLALVLFLMLTNEQYWDRISSILYAGEEVEGVDTGSSRLQIMGIQLKMARQHPKGTGHKGTMLLSPQYMGDDLLTGWGENRRRASHNTFLSFLVDHGAIGAFLYVCLTGWFLVAVLRAHRTLRNTRGLYAVMVPMLGAIAVTLAISDLTVNYLKLEIRYWFIALMMVVLNEIRKGTKVPERVEQRAAGPRRPRSYLNWHEPSP
ncbi:MAG: O-antigen ligase family protein [Gammaproteobacteria bacterium]|nr:O-antigen ligase family protein [Gammaproteobacteria bacterium]